MKNVKQLLNAKGNAMGGVTLREYNSDLEGDLPDEISGIQNGYKTKKEEAGAHSFL
jgi:hypothetical protein